MSNSIGRDELAHSSRQPMPGDTRTTLVNRGLALNYLTIGYNVLEAIVSLVAGVLAGSVALVGFGVDSVIEVTASGAAQWRLRVHHDDRRRERVETTTLRIIGLSFLGLAVYVTADSARTLYLREPPDRSVLGIVILALSAIVMPLLAKAKRNVARKLESRALEADAQQTSLSVLTCPLSLWPAWRSTPPSAGGGLTPWLRWQWSR